MCCERARDRKIESTLDTQYDYVVLFKTTDNKDMDRTPLYYEQYVIKIAAKKVHLYRVSLVQAESCSAAAAATRSTFTVGHGHLVGDIRHNGRW